MKKARSAREAKRLTDIPNVGPEVERDLVRIGIKTPQHLQGKNAYRLYRKLCAVTNARHDPCVLDTFMAAVDFMSGERAKPWWAYTARRKDAYPDL